MQDKHLIVRLGMPSAMLYCKIPMTPIAAIPSQNFLRTSTSAAPSQKTTAFFINVLYCFFSFWPCGLYHLSCFCETLALQQSTNCGTAANSAADLKVLPSGTVLRHSVHSV